MFVPDKRRLGHGSDRAGRLFQILTLLQESTTSSTPERWWTSFEIAHAIGMKPSQYQRQMLYELASEGCLEYRLFNRPCGIGRYEYRFCPDAFHLERWREAWQAWQPQVQMTLGAALS